MVNDPDVRGWGVAGETGGLLWAQDYFLEGASMDQIRSDDTVRSGVVATIDSLEGGSWTVTPYDTWTGAWLEQFTVECPFDAPCVVPLPDFSRDLAFKLEKG
jgi:hypothetical protein